MFGRMICDRCGVGFQQSELFLFRVQSTCYGCDAFQRYAMRMAQIRALQEKPQIICMNCTGGKMDNGATCTKCEGKGEHDDPEGWKLFLPINFKKVRVRFF